MSQSKHPLSPLFSPANVVTLTRIVLIPVFMVVLLSPWPSWIHAPQWVDTFQPAVAAFVYLLLAATDGLDGYLARSRNEVTTFGKFLDPIADKILVAAALLALVQLGTLPSWIALVILSREFIISGLRMVASVEGVVIAASWYGKAKTFAQMAAIILFLVKDSDFLAGIFSSQGVIIVNVVSWAIMLIAVLLTLLSMVDYFVSAKSVLVGPWEKKNS